ncbi:MAG: hypothetical protein WCQ99_07270, partial [Pseudomonadota bacterium]
SASASQELSAQAFHMKSLVVKLGGLVTGSGQELERRGRRFDDIEKGKLVIPRQQKFPVRSGEMPRRQAKARNVLASPGKEKPVEVRADEIIPFDDDELKDF